MNKKLYLKLIAAVYCISICFVAVPAHGQAFNVNPMLERSESPEIIAKLQDLAWENYEAFRVSELLIDRSGVAIRNARLEWFDALDIVYNYYPDWFIEEGSPDLYSRFGISVRLNLGRIFRTPGRIRIAKIDERIFRNELSIQRKRINRELMEHYSFFLQSAERLQLMIEAVENSQSTVESVRQRFERGDLDVQAMQRAEEYLVQERLRLIVARTDFFKSRYAVEEIIGVPIETVFMEN
ncbi:MAG: TolC family protein [Balneolales bacterium]|nr:TolC family protein [Balneolales bacterium]